MRKTLKLLALSLGVAVLVGALGIGAAFAADPTPTPSTNYHSVFVSKLAQALGVDQSKVDPALTQARDATIDQAVKDGQITQQQADWMKQRLQQAQAAGFGPGYGGPFGGPWGGPRGGRFGGAYGAPFGGPWQTAPTPTPTY